MNLRFMHDYTYLFVSLYWQDWLVIYRHGKHINTRCMLLYNALFICILYTIICFCITLGKGMEKKGSIYNIDIECETLATKRFSDQQFCQFLYFSFQHTNYYYFFFCRIATNLKTLWSKFWWLKYYSVSSIDNKE